MTRILLVLITVLATAVVLWSSWRVDRRLFAGVAALAAVVLGTLGYQLLDTREDEWQPVPADQVRLSINDAHVTESGVRLTGTLDNRSERPVGRVQARVEVADCPADAPCRMLAQAPMDLRLQVPPRTEYPYTEIIRMTVSKAAEAQQWRVEVKSVYGYRR